MPSTDRRYFMLVKREATWARPLAAWEIFLWRLGLSVGWAMSLDRVPHKWVWVRFHDTWRAGKLAGNGVTISLRRLRLGVSWGDV